MRRCVLLAGHCDQIGLVVTIDEKGFLYTKPIGGWDPQQLIGQHMTVWARSGPVPAVIAQAYPPAQSEERDKVVKLEEMWLDISATDKDGTWRGACRRLVTLELGYREMRNGLANSPGMDNITGVWVVVEALRRAARNR